MNRLFFLCILGQLALAGDTLFVLKRSTNNNEVVYEFVHKACEPDSKNPIHPFWIMRTKGGKTEELTTLEKKKAYGVIIKSISQAEVTFSLKAVSDRVLTAKCVSDTPVALLPLNGRNAILKSVFVKTKGNGLIPKVESVSLKGEDLATHENLEEILKK